MANKVVTQQPKPKLVAVKPKPVAKISTPKKSLFETNKPAFVDSVMNANKNLDWVKRAKEKNPESIQVKGKEGRSTHLMASGDARVYPTVVKDKGQLKHLGGKEARRYADSTNTAIKFSDDAKATWFGENYKQGATVLPSLKKKKK